MNSNLSDRAKLRTIRRQFLELHRKFPELEFECCEGEWELALPKSVDRQLVTELMEPLVITALTELRIPLTDDDHGTSPAAWMLFVAENAPDAICWSQDSGDDDLVRVPIEREIPGEYQIVGVKRAARVSVLVINYARFRARMASTYMVTAATLAARARDLKDPVALVAWAVSAYSAGIQISQLPRFHDQSVKPLHNCDPTGSVWRIVDCELLSDGAYSALPHHLQLAEIAARILTNRPANESEKAEYSRWSAELKWCSSIYERIVHRLRIEALIVSRDIFQSERSPAKPHYDADRRELMLDGKVIKKFRQKASKQEPVLKAFEESGWPSAIDAPLLEREIAPAVKRLNRKLKEIRFECDGTGERILWNLADETK